MSTQNPWYASIPMILRTHIITLVPRAPYRIKQKKAPLSQKKASFEAEKIG